MFVQESEVTKWMELQGYAVYQDNGWSGYIKSFGKIKKWVSYNFAATNYCYSFEEMRTDKEGNILNEHGEVAKKGQAVLRDSNSGYVLVRMGQESTTLP